MDILGVRVSENATRHINRLCGSFRKPVEFFPVEERRDEPGGGRVSLDVTNSERYAVRLATDLDRNVFEANVLYELLYIRQFETGFPTLGNKSSPLFFSDRDFVEGIGGAIFSGVLDVEVYDRLRECGYSSTVDWFASNIFNGLISIASNKYSDLDDKYSFANLVITFAKVLFHTNAEQDGKVRESFADYPLVLERSFDIRDMLCRHHPDAPAPAAVAMGHMIDILGLWDLFYIRLSDKRIRTRSEFEAFSGGFNEN